MHNPADIAMAIFALLAMYCLIRALLLWDEFAEHWMHDPTDKPAKNVDEHPPD